MITIKAGGTEFQMKEEDLVPVWEGEIVTVFDDKMVGIYFIPFMERFVLHMVTENGDVIRQCLDIDTLKEFILLIINTTDSNTMDEFTNVIVTNVMKYTGGLN